MINLFNFWHKHPDIKTKGKNNIVALPRKMTAKHAKIRINGNNCRLKIGENFNSRQACEIILCGDDISLTIGDNFTSFGKILINLTGKQIDTSLGANILVHKNLSLQTVSLHNNVKNHIGNNTSFGDVEIFNCEQDSTLFIGEDCMFSFGIKINNTDGHIIIDSQSGQRINKAEKLQIGSHVWVGQGAAILKNVTIGNNNIVGGNSIVTKSFPEENCVIAGVPAKIRKRGINWLRDNA